MFAWNKLEYPIILCPPMDGITDLAYREIIAEFGGSSVLYCEFINVKGLIYGNPKTLFELRYTEIQRPIIAQLFGNDPADFYEAAKIVVRMGFDAIDINMGCPAHKVASKGCGCALMNNTENAKNIVEMTIKGANEEFKKLHPEVNNYEFPVTTKMRLGINTKDLVFEHGLEMIQSGSKAIAIHGRTLKQMYTGEADWEPIKKFKEIVLEKFSNSDYIPKVFGSGDVKSLYEAYIRIITTNADGVMIGRGSFGNLWVFEKARIKLLQEFIKQTRIDFGKEIIDEFELQNYSKIEEIKKSLENQPRSFDEIKNLAIKHAELLVKDKGEKGILQMRKHLGWYFTGFDGAKELRSQLMRVNSIDELKDILSLNK